MLLFRNCFAVTYFFKYLFEHGKNVRHLAHMTICTSSQTAATELLGKEELTGQNILLPGAERVDEAVLSELTSAGNSVTLLTVSVHGVQDNGEAIDLECASMKSTSLRRPASEVCKGSGGAGLLACADREFSQ